MICIMIEEKKNVRHMKFYITLFCVFEGIERENWDYTQQSIRTTIIYPVIFYQFVNEEKV